jgi:uncharacterized protein YegP (UPF0339 family)
MRTFLRVLVPAVALTAFVAAGGIDVPTAAQAKKDAKDKTGGATFVIYETKSGAYRFRLVAGDGTKLCDAVKNYDNKEEVMALIESIRKEAAKAKLDDETEKTTKKTKSKEKE